MVIGYLKEAKAQLEDALLRCKFELADCAPGRIALVRKGQKQFYYQELNNNGKQVRKGITKDVTMIKELARKEYLQKVIPALEANLRVLDRALLDYKPCEAQEICKQLSSKYQKLPKEFLVNSLVDSVALDLDARDIERINRHREWGAQECAASDYMVDGRTLVTSRGEYMRSKAEVLIAEKLYEYGIPFRYEQALELVEITYHPDFTFEAADGSEFYLEFCGMMDNETYVAAHRRKYAAYEAAGIVPWNNIIYVYAANNEMDMRRIDSIIRTQVIPWL